MKKSGMLVKRLVQTSSCLLRLKRTGIEIFNVEYTGLYVTEENGKIYLNSLDFDEDGNVVMPTEDGTTKYQKPIPIDPENTILFARGLNTFGYTTNRRWVDTIRNLEDKGFKTIPSINTWDMCSSKYYCDQLMKANGLRTPTTVPITYSDDSERAVEQGKLKFPLILKHLLEVKQVLALSLQKV